MRDLLLLISVFLFSFALSAQKTQTIHSVDGVTGATKEWNSQVKLHNIVVDNSQLTTIVYPFNGSLFPADISPASFMWKTSNPNVKSWNLTFETEGQSVHKTTDTTYFKPDVDLWEQLKDISQQQPITFSIESIDKKESATIKIQFSKDSVNAPIFYRAVRLPFRHANKYRDKLEWYLGDVSSNRKRQMLDNMPVCANCHSFSRDGSTFAMDVDYANDKGNYTISPVEKESTIIPDDIISWSDYKKEDNVKTFGLLAKISPDGKYAISTVKDRSIFLPVDNSFWYSQLFFPIKGILAWHDVESGQIKELKGADNPDYVQSSPEWSPNMKEVLFSKAKCSKDTSLNKNLNVIVDLKYAAEYINREKDFKFDLYRIPWNNGNGGKAIPIKGASNNNKSNYFARYSPDGKWIVFCQAENFMLLQPDSKLYIMPAKGGEPRLMNCNAGEMNSWHSFSPNSKWMVYSSKHFGPYTQIFLTHIDDNGNDTPPVWLEQLTVDKKAANIPEFVNIDFDETWFSIHDGFTASDTYLSDLINKNIKSKNYEKAHELSETEIKNNPDNYFGYYSRANISVDRASNDKNYKINNKQIGADFNKAIELLKGDLAKNNNDPVALSYLGASYFSVRQDQKAMYNCKLAIEIDPENILAWQTLSSIYNSKSDAKNTILANKKLFELTKIATYMNKCAQIKLVRGLYQEAIEDALLVIGQDPCNFWAHEIIADCYVAMKDFVKAEAKFNEIIDCGPTEGKNYISRGKFYLNQKEYEKAIADFSKCLQFDGLNLPALQMRATAYIAINDMDSAIEALSQAVGRDANDNILFLLAKCQLAKDDFSEALKNAKKAKDMIYSSKTYSNDSFKNLIEINRIIKECELKLN